MTNQVLQSTLLPGANPVALFASAGSAYLAEPGRGEIALLKGNPPALQQELPVPANPVYVVGLGGAPRYYSISQGSGVGPGFASAIETTNNAVSNTIPVGKGPIYGVMTGDGRRAFILNKTDGTVSVINSQANQLDQFVTGSFTGTTTSGSPNITAVSSIAGLTAGQLVSGTGIPAGTTILSATGSTVVLSANATASGTGAISSYSSNIPVGIAPLWADLAPTRAELVVANQGNGTAPGSVTIVNIPLCSTVAQNNPNCDPNNPVDAVGFGQVLANVPVGHSPVMVAVLQDGTRAYVANYADSTVSVVNLTSNTVTATIPVVGRPIYIAATQGTPTGKVYVVSADTIAPNKNSVMTVIRTDIDAVSTTINLQGTGVSVRVTQP